MIPDVYNYSNIVVKSASKYSDYAAIWLNKQLKEASIAGRTVMDIGYLKSSNYVVIILTTGKLKQKELK